jgi:DNA-binding CsgD family transcriptional regulator
MNAMQSARVRSTSNRALSASEHSNTPRTRGPKRFLSWEQQEFATKGFYKRHLDIITKTYPTLSVMESRVAALASGLLPSSEIARILGIAEHSVENYRSAIRKKIGLPKAVPLTRHLQNVILAAR